MKKRLLKICLPGLLLAAILILDVASIRHKSPTYDEAAYLSYGLKVLRLDFSRRHPGTAPFSSWNALLGKAGELFRKEKSGNFPGDLNSARFATVIFSLLLAVYIFKWARELYGFTPALFSLFLYAFSPTIIAHSRLITSDLYTGVMMTISIYYFWKFLQEKGGGRVWPSAMAAGLSQLSKYTCLLLYPIFILLACLKYSGAIRRLCRPGGIKVLARAATIFIKFSLLFVVIGVIIINLGFAFQGTLTPLGKYKFRSRVFTHLQSRLSLFQDWPVPLPYPYLEGIDWKKWQEETGRGFGYMYLLGELKKVGGFRCYYLYAFIYKVPIPILIFLILALVSYSRNRKKYNFLHDEVFLLVPVLFLFLYFSLAVKAQLGIRYLLPIFPFLFIFCGSFFARWSEFSRGLKIGLSILAVYLVVSVLSYFPHYLSYFNEFVWDRKQAYLLLADSNIDWGQNRWYLDSYRKDHPGVYVNPAGPVAGRVVVSVNNLVGVWNPEQYRWLRENFSPVDHVAYSYLVFDVPLERLEGGEIETPLKN